MMLQEFQKEVLFGLENLNRVKNDIDSFHAGMAAAPMRNSALAYAGMGYYDALEHLMVRTLKFLEITLPAGAASHQMILAEFQNALVRLGIAFFDFSMFKRLLGFRHVATKIYGFLINDDKLAEVIATIQIKHTAFVDLFQTIIRKVETGST